MRAGDLYVSALRAHRLAPVAITSQDEDPDYKAASVDDLTHPERVWKPKTTTPDAPYVAYDLGSVVPITVIYAGWITPGGATTIRVEASDQQPADWGSPTYQGSLLDLTAHYHYALKRYHLAWFPAALSARHVRFVAAAYSGVPCSLGQLLALGGGTAVPNRAPHDHRWRAATLENTFATGGRERRTVGPRQQMITLDWAWAMHAAAGGGEDAIMFSADLQVAVDEILFVCRDRTHLPHWASLYRPSGEIEVQSPQGLGASMPLGYDEIVG